MSDIQQILIKENSNESHIHLYKVDKYWCAFERSAFHLFSIYNVDAVFKVEDTEQDNTMLVAIVKTEICNIENSQITIIKESDNEIVIGFRANLYGFKYWKESFTSLFTRNLFTNLDITSIHNYKILPL
ncbi:MAG: hypothetical protein LBV43_09950 [Prevotella sp.]|jgi:hypothetical protein|nr:hypothetical protein [Prevotella sp.]